MAPGRATGAPDSMVVAELERAELAARERRLAAGSEADRILAAAAARVAEIEAGVDGRVAAAVAALKTAQLGWADVEVAGIEAELEASGGAAVDGRDVPDLDPAIAYVVARVLAERAG